MTRVSLPTDEAALKLFGSTYTKFRNTRSRCSNAKRDHSPAGFQGRGGNRVGLATDRALSGAIGPEAVR
jgi:hypothetical protein